MKTSIRMNMNGINFELILFIAFALGILAGKANAQGYSRIAEGLYIGVETTTGSRSFTINSDLQTMKNLKVTQHGKTYGITMGNRIINGKIRIGNFTAPRGDSQPIQSNTFELGSSFSPLQLINGKPHVFEPYLTLSFETAKIKSNGTFTPPPVLTKPKSSTCSCQCPTSSSGMMPDPDAPAVSSPVPYVGKFGSTRANVGVGLRAHLQKGKLFLNVFGEMNYGVTLGTTASTQALLNTYVLNQIAFNAGAAIGIIHSKSTGRRLKRVRFR